MSRISGNSQGARYYMEGCGNIKELYPIYIEYMRHENDLLNQRTTWFLAIQSGLLAAAYYLIFKYIDIFTEFSREDHRHVGEFPLLNDILGVSITAIWLAVCLGGFITAVFAKISIDAALQAQRRLNEEWKRNFGLLAEFLRYPDISGGGDEIAGINGGLFASCLPFVMIIAWFVFPLILSILAVFHNIFIAIFLFISPPVFVLIVFVVVSMAPHLSGYRK